MDPGRRPAAKSVVPGLHRKEVFPTRIELSFANVSRLKQARVMPCFIKVRSVHTSGVKPPLDASSDSRGRRVAVVVSLFSYWLGTEGV